VYSLIGDKIMETDPIEYEKMAREIKEELTYQLNIAVLSRLPDEALDELEKYEDSPDDYDALVHEQIVKYGLDINTITFDTMMRFAELYKQPTAKGDVVEEAKNWSDERLDSELLGTAKTFRPQQFPNDSDEAHIQELTNFAMECIQKRFFCTAYEELLKLRKTVPADDIDDVTLWVSFLLMIKLERIADKCDEVRQRTMRPGYNDLQLEEDILALRAMWHDCRDHKAVKELMEKLIRN
jgi:hypothetical protein